MVLGPNLRLRDTYTHTTRLAQIATGREAPGTSAEQQRFEAFQDVLDDELRQLHHATGRARQQLIVTCGERRRSALSFLRGDGFCVRGGRG